jgi:hypothetical protein
MNHKEAKNALFQGKKLRNVRYPEDEFIFLNSDSNIVTEEGYNMHTFNDEFWQFQLKLPERWYIIEH